MINPEVTSLKVGATIKLASTITPSNADVQTIVWTSSNPSVATVDAAGNVKGVAAGTATITGKTTDGGFVDTSAITVTT